MRSQDAICLQRTARSPGLQSVIERSFAHPPDYREKVLGENSGRISVREIPDCFDGLGKGDVIQGRTEIGAPIEPGGSEVIEQRLEDFLQSRMGVGIAGIGAGKFNAEMGKTGQIQDGLQFLRRGWYGTGKSEMTEENPGFRETFEKRAQASHNRTRTIDAEDGPLGIQGVCAAGCPPGKLAGFDRG